MNPWCASSNCPVPSPVSRAGSWWASVTRWCWSNRREAMRPGTNSTATPSLTGTPGNARSPSIRARPKVPLSCAGSLRARTRCSTGAPRAPSRSPPVSTTSYTYGSPRSASSARAATGRARIWWWPRSAACWRRSAIRTARPYGCRRTRRSNSPASTRRSPSCSACGRGAGVRGSSSTCPRRRVWPPRWRREPSPICTRTASRRARDGCIRWSRTACSGPRTAIWAVGSAAAPACGTRCSPGCARKARRPISRSPDGRTPLSARSIRSMCSRSCRISWAHGRRPSSRSGPRPGNCRGPPSTCPTNCRTTLSSPRAASSPRSGRSRETGPTSASPSRSRRAAASRRSACPGPVPTRRCSTNLVRRARSTATPPACPPWTAYASSI